MGIYERITGEVYAEISGAFPGSVLNAAAAQGIELKMLEYADETSLRLRFSERDMPVMEDIIRRCMCDITVLSIFGGSKTGALIKHRLRLLLFILPAICALICSSLFIWEIDIRGNEALSDGEILRALSEAGVDYGSFWPGMNVETIRSDTQMRLPEIGWMAINVSGSRAVVLVRERREKPEIYSAREASDIIASRTGIIRRVSTLNGMALAQIGDAVTEGEMLISGTMDSVANGSRYVCAKGSVIADTWYEHSSITPLDAELKTPHRFSLNRFAFIIGKKRINLYLSSGKTIDECDKIICEYKLGVKGLFALPVTLVREKLTRYDCTAGCDADTAAMRQRLTDTLRSRVIGEINSMSFSEGNYDGVYVLTLRAHCTEEIGKTVPLF